MWFSDEELKLKRRRKKQKRKPMRARVGNNPRV
jgi:hypothetical protein